MAPHLNRHALSRVLQDKLRDEHARLHPGAAAALPPGPWDETLPLTEDGICADSLDRFHLAAAVNAMFHIHQTGLEDTLLARKTFGAWLDAIDCAWSRGVADISFASSGSTGQPRMHTHRLADLQAEAAAHAAHFAPRRIFAAVPAHHIYGFIFTALLPQITGAELLDCRARLPGPPPFAAGDLLVSFPDHWRYLARSLPHLPPLTGISSTAMLPADLAARLRAGGLARLVEIYGASETGGIAWRDASDAPYTLLDHWSFAGGDEPALRSADGRTVPLPDIVERAGPRCLRLLGRKDGAVQIGGMNVYPRRVAAALQARPGVAHARARIAETPSGPRLEALVIASDPACSADALRAALLHWAGQRLTPPERPARITIAAALPRNAMGKEAGWL